jgi:hypothetical protein
LTLILAGIALAALCLAMKHTSTKLTLRTETVRHLSGEQLRRAGGGGTITQVDPPTTGTGTGTKNGAAGPAGGAGGGRTTGRTI